jgi:flagellar biosynthetic protein FliR
LGLVIDSFNSMPIGQSLMGQAAWGQLVTWSSMIFLGGLLTALPVMVTLLFINIGLGVATRAAPSLNVFSLGFPAMVIAGFVIMILSLPSVGARIQWMWLQGLTQTRSLVGLP